MSEDQYFVIHNSEGETRVSVMMSKEALTERLGEDYWGDAGIMTVEDLRRKGGGTDYWDGKLLIIKGTVARVTPPGDWRVE